MLKPKHPCAIPNCPNLTDRKHCAQHYQKRPSATAAGYGFKWRGYSKRFLARPENAFCKDPYQRHRGQHILATVTGHRVAHKGNHELLWNLTNHIALCASCNAFQCVKEEGGFGNEMRMKSETIINNLQSGKTYSF